MSAGNGFGFESGSNGDALTTGNSGADAIGSPVSGSMGISTAQKAHGTRSALMSAGAASGVTYISKTIAGTDTLTVRLYVRWTALPTGTIAPCLVWLAAGTSQLCNLEVTAAGLLRIRDDASGNAWTSTTAFALNTWYRVEFSVARNASTGSVRAAIYALDSTTPIEDSGTITGKNTGASPITTIRIGMKASTGTMEAAGYIDDWDYDPTTLAFIGPHVDALPAPSSISIASVTNPTTVGGTNGAVTIEWGSSAGATTYEVAIVEGEVTSGFTADATDSASPHAFTGLEEGTYTVAVRAV